MVNKMIDAKTAREFTTAVKPTNSAGFLHLCFETIRYACNQGDCYCYVYPKGSMLCTDLDDVKMRLHQLGYIIKSCYDTKEVKIQIRW